MKRCQIVKSNLVHCVLRIERQAECLRPVASTATPWRPRTKRKPAVEETPDAHAPTKKSSGIIKQRKPNNTCCSRKHAARPLRRLRFERRKTLHLASKVFFCILLTGLCRLAHLLAYYLPLAGLVLLDGGEERSALVLGELGIVHVLRCRLARSQMETTSLPRTAQMSTARDGLERGHVRKVCFVSTLRIHISSSSAARSRRSSSDACQQRTLYQCFFTLPSVLMGKDFAISLQLVPASRRFFSLCSSAGVHGVLVRPFLATGCCSGCSSPTSCWPRPPGSPYADEPGWGAMALGRSWPDARRFRGLVGVGGGGKVFTAP